MIELIPEKLTSVFVGFEAEHILDNDSFGSQECEKGMLPASLKLRSKNPISRDVLEEIRRNPRLWARPIGSTASGRQATVVKERRFVKGLLRQSIHTLTDQKNFHDMWERFWIIRIPRVFSVRESRTDWAWKWMQNFDDLVGKMLFEDKYNEFSR